MSVQYDALQLQEKIRQSKALWANYIVRSTKMSDVFLDIIRKRTPVDKGDTQRSWTIHMHQSTDSILWEISPDGREKEVFWLEFGTKSHPIPLPQNKGAKTLHFYWKKINQWMFLKKVWHPGTKPLGIVRITQDEVNQEAEALAWRLHDQLRQLWS